MTTTPPHPQPGTASAPAAVGPGSGLRETLGRIGPLVLLFNLGWSTTNNAGGSYLQAASDVISPADPIGFYTTASTVGALLAAIAIVITGALSDRTRSRFGKRAPWIAGGAIVGSLGLMLTGASSSRVLVVIGWAVFQMSINAMIAAVLAVAPDHLVPRIYGRMSGIAGLGVLLGTVAGGALTAVFITRPQHGLLAVPWIMLVICVVVAIALPRRSSRHEPRPEGGARGFLRSLTPPADLQYWLVFIGRFLFVLALYMVVLYQVFIASDYIGLDRQGAGNLIATASAVLAVCAGTATVIAGPLSDRLGRRPFVIAAPLLTAVAVIPMMAFRTPWAFLVFFAIGGLAYGAYLSVDAAMMLDVLPDQDHVAKDLSILNASNTLPAVFAPLVAGTLASAVGYEASFIAVAVTCVVAAACILPVRRVR
jgi:MFS family permease